MRSLFTLALVAASCLFVSSSAHALMAEPAKGPQPIPFVSEGVDAERTAYLADNKYTKENADAKAFDVKNILIAKTDINGDGTSDMLVYIDDSFYCGSQGCTFSGYISKDGKWVKVMPDMIVPKDLNFTGDKHNGFLDISIINSKGQTLVWAYDDTKGEYSPIDGKAVDQKILF